MARDIFKEQINRKHGDNANEKKQVYLKLVDGGRHVKNADDLNSVILQKKLQLKNNQSTDPCIDFEVIVTDGLMLEVPEDE